MVAVVLFTTLLTPLALRGAFQIQCPEDMQEAEFAAATIALESEP
jgi:hypothetical protein